MSRLRRLVIEIHRRSLWQVLGIYGLTSWAIYQVVLALYEGIGLPEWVPGTALVLLLIGLPVVLATAFVQEGAPRLQRDERGGTIDGLETTQQAVAATRRGDEPGEAAVSQSPRAPAFASPNTSTTTSTKPRRGTLFTWPRAVTAGVLAFAGLGLAASGFMGMRALGIGPAATLISSGVLDETDPLILADFQSPMGDSLLALALTDAFRVGLEQSRSVKLVPATRVSAALSRMRHEENVRLTPRLAREIGQREGLKATIEGELNSVGSTFVVIVRVVSVESGEPLVSLSATAADSGGLIPTVGELAVDVRERVGESLRSIRSSAPLADVTTASLPALRKYSQAWRVRVEQGDDERAATLMEEAIAEDSSFAMAWRGLGALLWGVDRARMADALTRAHELSVRLPERERYHAQAVYYSDVLGDHARAIKSYETLLQSYPDDSRALHNIGREYGFLLMPHKADEYYERAVASYGDEAGTTTRRNLLWHHQLQGRWTAYDSLAAEYARLFPDHTYNYLHRANLAAARADHRKAAAIVDSVAEEQPGRQWQRIASWEAGHLAAARGRLREARRHFARYTELADQADAPADRLRAAVVLATYEALLLGDVDQGLARVEQALERDPLASLDPFDRSYVVLASFYAAVGEDARGLEMLQAYADSTPAANRWPGLELYAERTRGFIDIAAGDAEKGLERVRRLADELNCGDCFATDLGRAFDLAGQPDSALHYLELGLRHGTVRTTAFDELGWALPYLGFFYGRAGELHEEQEDRAAAAGRYQDLIDLWQDADPELQPRVESARRALARLSREGGG